MNLVENVGRAVSVVRTHPIPMLTLGLCAVISQLPYAFVQPSLARDAWPLDIAVSLASFLVWQIVYAAIVFASAQGASGDTPGVVESLQAAIRRGWALIEFVGRSFGAALVLALTIVGIPFAIRILVRWFFGPEAIMLRGVDAKEAISLSSRITTGHSWRLAGTLLLFIVVIGGPVFAGSFLIGREVYIATWALLTTVTAPLSACFWTLVFSDLEARPGVAQTAPAPAS